MADQVAVPDQSYGIFLAVGYLLVIAGAGAFIVAIAALDYNIELIIGALVIKLVGWVLVIIGRIRYREYLAAVIATRGTARRVVRRQPPAPRPATVHNPVYSTPASYNMPPGAPTDFANGNPMSFAPPPPPYSEK